MEKQEEVDNAGLTGRFKEQVKKGQRFSCESEA